MPIVTFNAARKIPGHERTPFALYLDMPEPRDGDVLALLEQGDPRGFDLAYARYAERVFAFLLRLSRSRPLAQDLFQHTFMRLAEVGPRLRTDSDLRAWLFSVARNAFHSHARSARSARVEAGADVEHFPTPVAASTSPDAGLGLADVERALARLNASDRELLLLFAVEGLSHPELSKVFSLDQATVRKRVSRARARLAEALDEDTRAMSKSRLSE